MTRASKLGLASLLFALLCPFLSGLELPFSFVLAFLSCVLGLLAGAQGSKWWLTIPAAVIAISVGLFLITSQIA